MVKYIFLTNIPTPYRTAFYNDLQRHGLEFEVLYMRHIEADRNWKINREDLQHPHIIDNGFYRMIGRFHVHFNPKLISHILKNKNSEIIVGGAWNDIDVLILVLLRRLKIIRNPFHFWSEANYLTIGASNDNQIKKLIRKFVYHASNGCQLSSGKMTEITLAKWGIRVNGFVPLPNTIEEEKFVIHEEEVAKRNENPLPVFIMPVRLLEQDKGIMNFFKALGNENTRQGLFLVAGEGPDKPLIESYIQSEGLEENIKLLGHCDTQTMISLYKQANVFVLPSFSDPSPLSLIEAIRMKLPVLVSERCGNHFEAVIPESNGYIFNPLDPVTVRNTFANLFIRRTEWHDMGELSATIYNKNFRKETVIMNFINSLRKFSSRLIQKKP